jgi:hypothetical protein
LWHDGEHDCPKCPQAGPDAYVIHDYLDHQRSASEVADLRAKRAAAGQRGGKRSGESRRAASAAEANDEAFASDLVKQAGSKNEPETETETEEEQKTSRTSAKSSDNPPREDVEQVCKHLATVIEEGGDKRPRITAKWRTDMRRLFDVDGITPDQAITAINWAHANDFWQAHILSPAKLREKYPTLRRQAAAERAKRAPQGPQTAPHDTSSMTEEEKKSALRIG